MKKNRVFNILFSLALVAIQFSALNTIQNANAASETLFDDFSTYSLGSVPSGWSQFGTTAITPQIVNYGGTGASFQRVRFPAYTAQQTYKWLIHDSIMAEYFTATIKINFQSSSDGAGMIVAWKDSNNYIAVLPNPFWDEIVVWEFVDGQIRSTFNQGGRYSVPISTNSDYWLRVVTLETQTGEKQLKVYWSTDGVNFSQKDTATNLYSLAGQIGIGSYQYLSDVLFDDFTFAETSEVYPIILLPGIMGSKLTNSPTISSYCSERPSGEIWIEELVNNRLRIFANFSTLMLKVDGSGNVISENICDHITPTGIMNSGDFNYYGGIEAALNTAGYDVIPFPYDWRLSIETNAQLLDQVIHETVISTGASKVILLGHSMGGLLAREYISDASRAQYVDKVISVGSPYWGAPKLAQAMREGITGIPDLDKNTWLLGETIKKLIRNSPGSMELLPSRTFVEQFSPYYWVDSQALTFDQTTEHFAANGQNGVLLEQATLFHEEIDDFRSENMNGVPYFVFASNSLPTPSAVVEIPCQLFRTCFYVPKYFSGDGTVPWVSARLRGISTDLKGSAQVCTLNVSSDHSGLLNDTVVQNAVVKVLNGSPLSSTDCQELDPGSGTMLSSQAITMLVNPFVELVIQGNNKVVVTDADGHIATIGDDGLIVNEIPSAIYEVVNATTTVLLPPEVIYTITIYQHDESANMIRVTDFRNVTSLEEFEPYERAVFVDVPSNNSGIVTIMLNYSNGMSSLNLGVDTDGDGNQDELMTPTNILDSEQSQDYTVPSTNFLVTGQTGTLGFYTGQVIVTLEATDNATSVINSEYSLDGGINWYKYTNPITLTAEDVPYLLARSTDGAGNKEYPYPQLRLIPYSISLPIIIK